MPHQYRIAADVGNSAIKLAAADAHYCVQSSLSFHRLAPDAPDFADQLANTTLRFGEQLGDRQTTFHWRLAIVQRTFARKLTDWITATRPADTVETVTANALAMEVAVDEPDRVGIDRLVAAHAARLLKPAALPAIVIDAGSAVTVDLLSPDGTYQGGAILPGRRLQLDSLAGGTDLLPAIAYRIDESVTAPATNTIDAIRLGIEASIAGAVERLVDRYTARFPKPPTLYLSGGDAEWLATLLQSKTSVIPDLVLRGLLA